MTYVACTVFLLLLALFTAVYLHSQSLKKVLGITDFNGKRAFEFKDRYEIIDTNNIHYPRFNVYKDEDITKFIPLIDDLNQSLRSMIYEINQEIMLQSKNANIDVTIWKIESITIHDLTGNCTIFVDFPDNKKIKWGMEVDVNLKSKTIDQIEFCH